MDALEDEVLSSRSSIGIAKSTLVYNSVQSLKSKVNFVRAEWQLHTAHVFVFSESIDRIPHRTRLPIGQCTIISVVLTIPMSSLIGLFLLFSRKCSPLALVVFITAKSDA